MVGGQCFMRTLMSLFFCIGAQAQTMREGGRTVSQMRHDFWRQPQFLAPIWGFTSGNQTPAKIVAGNPWNWISRLDRPHLKKHWMHFHGFFQQARKESTRNPNNVWNISVSGLVFVPKERNWGGVPLFVPDFQVANFRLTQRCAETRREGRGWTSQ